MAFKDFPKNARGAQLLQRSLARGRLGHAYLFSGDRWKNWNRLPARWQKL